MPSRRPFWLLVAVIGVSLLTVASISPAPAASPAQAIARAYERLGPDEEDARGLVRATREGAERGLGTSVRASTSGGSATADASATAERVNLFSGLVTVAVVTTSATATDAGTELEGEISELAIEGRAIASPQRERTYRLGRYGKLVALETGRTGIAGLRLRLTRSYRGHAAGSEVTVAYSSARARDGTPPAAAERERAAARRQAQQRRRARAERRREAREARSRPVRRRRAPRLEALRTARGYAFPVHAGFSYSDDWGAPRQHTGTHEGTDVFAATGTPVLAVTSGRLSRVGTRAIPGNRMWLKSDDGDEFFYGHLSAFAEAARNGAAVKAGDVIGFVGSTGDAEQTPPHLHFEVHPRGGEATNPYPFLRAWETRRDVPPAAWLERYGSDPGSRPGVLVVIEDYLK